MHKFEQIARERHKILWQYYNENGQLLLKNVIELTGTSYENVWKTMDTHNLIMPPVRDSRKEKTRRKAEVLNKEAARLKQDYLTLDQVAKVLNSKANYVLGIEMRMLRYGFSIPEIRNENNVTLNGKYYNSDPDDNFPEIAHRLHGVVNPLWHPEGLQVSSYWIDWPKEGLTTYLLR
jgi:hypothetical protein